MTDDRLARTFVELADTLVDEFDLVEFLHLLVDRCVELLEVSATGLMLADAQGRLRVMASSAENIRLLELFQLQNEEGPCLE
ncbi:MAG: transcriptional regulator, partial [Pseudonocardiaceae bacterium]